MKDFNFTHQARFSKEIWKDDKLLSIESVSMPVEIVDDGEINMIKPLEGVDMNKIEPMDDYPIFYACTLYAIANEGWKIEFTPLKK